MRDAATTGVRNGVGGAPYSTRGQGATEGRCLCSTVRRDKSEVDATRIAHIAIKRSTEQGASECSSYGSQWPVRDRRSAKECCAWRSKSRGRRPSLALAKHASRGHRHIFLLEALLRGLPVGVADQAFQADALSRNDVFIVALTLDRASANICVAKWFCHTLWNVSGFGPRITFHYEPCALHGCALVKQRCPTSKLLAAALYGFTRWLRVARNAQALTDMLHKKVDELLVVRGEPRPASEVDKARSFFEAVYGNSEEEDYLWVQSSRDGSKHKSALLLDLEALIDVVDLGAHSDTITFWNVVGEGSPQHLEGARVGSRIFSDRQSVVELVACPILNFCMGNAWVSATISRWTNVGTTQKRFLTASSASNILVESLQDVKVSWNLVGDSLEANLKAQIDKDRDDFASKNTLRMIKFMKVLGKPSLRADLVLATICSRPVDVLMYRLLGHGGQNRATVGDLIHPTKSLIAAFQDDMWKLTDLRCEAGRPWHIASLVGLDASSLPFRMASRRHILQISAGVTQVFELRMSAASGPHRLAWLCYDVVSLEVKEAIVRKLFKYPDECLPFMVLCLRKLYPSEALFLQKAPATLLVWLEVAHSIDFSERAHAQMRSDLASDGCARCFPSSADRLLVKQFLASHVERGGVDLSVAPVPLFDKTLKDEAPTSARARVGGSPFMHFHAMRLRTKKLLVGRGRALAAHELKRCEAEIKEEWLSILGNDVEYLKWKALFDAKRGQAKPALTDASCASSCGDRDKQPSPFQGLWHQSKSPQELIPLDALAAFELAEKEKGAARRNQDAKQRAEMLAVRSPVPDRTSSLDRGPGGWGSLFGCEGGLDNVCIRHGRGALRREALTNITGLINSWVSSMEPESRENASRLALFMGTTLEGHSRSVLALLVLSFKKPRAQMFAVCGFVLPGSSEMPRVHDTPGLPFRVRILDRLGRMCLPSVGSNRRAIFFETNIELAKYLGSMQDSWQLHNATYTLHDDSILDMVVNGREQFVPPARRAPTKARTSNLPAEFDMDSAFEVGWNDARDEGGEGAGGAGDFAEVLSGSEDDCLYRDDPPDDFIDVILEGADEAHEMPEVVDEPPHVHFDEEAMGGEAEDMMDMEEPPLPPPAEEPDRASRAVLESDCTSALGYVQCPVEPWSAKTPIARITHWPDHLAANKQSTSFRCYMHPGCSVARRRTLYSQEQYLRWLYSMEPLPPTASADEKKAAKHIHMGEKAIEFVPKVPPGAAAAAAKAAP